MGNEVPIPGSEGRGSGPTMVKSFLQLLKRERIRRKIYAVRIVPRRQLSKLSNSI